MSGKNFEDLSLSDKVQEAMQRITTRMLYFDSDLNVESEFHASLTSHREAFERASLVIRVRQSPDRAIEICVLKNRFGEPNGDGSVTLRLRGLT